MHYALHLLCICVCSRFFHCLLILIYTFSVRFSLSQFALLALSRRAAATAALVPLVQSVRLCVSVLRCAFLLLYRLQTLPPKSLLYLSLRHSLPSSVLFICSSDRLSIRIKNFSLYFIFTFLSLFLAVNMRANLTCDHTILK